MKTPLTQKLLLCLQIIFMSLVCTAQNKDSSFTNLQEVQLVGYKTVNGIGHFKEASGGVIYAGKKTEVIEVDSIDANKAINNTRQILGRIPGLNIVESETGGFVANGIGIRGLNPVQSLEMNVRQNGYNIAADVYGYNETYYLPPMEAVSRIELIKGASAIQFGSQMGGMVNYVLKEGSSHHSFNYSTMQTAGSDGLLNSFHAAGGTVKKIKYFGFINYRTLSGWRPNSQQKQVTGYGKIAWQANQKTNVGIEYSLLRNRIKMPGGLTDDQFEADSKASVRSRNWLKSPWNVVTASIDHTINENTSWQIKSTFLAGERSLVWFNKLPGEPDLADAATGEFANREVDKEVMKSSATEARLLNTFNIGKVKSTLATGIRFAVANFKRNEEAAGTNKSDFDLSVTGEYEENFNFTTINIAAFIENCFQLNEKFSITPGFRYESFASEVESEYEVNGVEKETEEEKTRGFGLFGIGLQYKAGNAANFYGNISQAYRPVDYAQLFPFGNVTKVDPKLKDPNGWNADIGVRGNQSDFFNYDISLFYLNYNNRIGPATRIDDTGGVYLFRTNVDKSIHRGIESFVELNITRALNLNKAFGDISIYNSFAYTDAKYTRGEFKDKRVAYAPAVINRLGLSYNKKWLMTSLQLSHQSGSYSDAANTERSTNPLIGRIPGYSVIDWSFTVNYKKFKFKGGINNLADKRYFTQRTEEYPGPGIIPSIGRGFYAGVGYNL
jgi:Fe(3+) dicitrate transport protein